MTGKLKKTLEWIDTLAEERGLNEEEREVAAVIARRTLDGSENEPLAKKVARKSVKEAPSKVE